MRKVCIILAFSLFCFISMKAQGFEMNISKTLTQDETLLSFDQEEGKRITGILASGSVSFTSSL